MRVSLLEAIEQLDLSGLTRAYAGRGSAAYHPEVMLGLLVYGYATGTFASRRIERATYDSVAGNDKEQVQPMLDKLVALPASLGKVEILLADTGFCSANNIAACEQAKVEPYIAVAREDHHPGWRERFTGPEPLAAAAKPMQKMAHKAQDQTGPDAECATQAYRGTGVRHHQVGHGVSAVLAAWPGEREGRVDLGLPGVESETHGRIAPENRPMPLKCTGIRSNLTPMRL